MKISIKTLSGELFQIEVSAEDKVSDIKQKIFDSKSNLSIERQKLIHSGKVLKDEQFVSELGLAEADFIVCMITKDVAKKPVAEPVPAPAPVPAPSLAPAVVSTPASVPAPAVTAVTQNVGSNAADRSEALQALINMGFPESECRAALTAAMGNPDLAYEFLLTGIPETSRAVAGGAQQNPSTTSGNVSIEQLRSHPQFNTLKRLVQQNPAALSQVLDIIGQQNPSLLAAIHANTDAFLRMMNEPITDAPVSQSPPPAQPGTPTNPMNDPLQMMNFLNSLPADQRAQFAQSLGMSSEQLQGFMNMMSALPSGELQNLLRQNSGSAGQDPPGVIRLTHDEMAAVNRLMSLGFSQQQAAQAYLACDKNEELAANLLLEGGWAEDEGDFGDDGDNYH